MEGCFLSMWRALVAVADVVRLRRVWPQLWALGVAGHCPAAVHAGVATDDGLVVSRATRDHCRRTPRAQFIERQVLAAPTQRRVLAQGRGPYVLHHGRDRATQHAADSVPDDRA